MLASSPARLLPAALSGFAFGLLFLLATGLLLAAAGVEPPRPLLLR